MTPKTLSRLFNHYFFTTYFVVLVLLSQNIQSTNLSDLRSSVFTAIVFLTYGFIYLLPALFITKLSIYIYSLVAYPSQLIRRILYVTVVLLTSFTLVLLYADYNIYSIFGFHFNGFVWNLITTSGGIASMGGSDSSMVTYGVAVIGLLALQAIILWVIIRTHFKRNNVSNTRQIKIYRYLIVIFFIATLGERVTYGVSSIQGYTPVLAASNAFPFYLPMTFRSWAKSLGIEVDRNKYKTVDLSHSKLVYPKKPIVIDTKQKPLNIIWLVAESLRADMLTPEIMPASWAFANKSHRFTHHYSGANMTRMGMFSMFYGLYGAYWFPFLDERRSPVIMDVIQKRNYQYEMFTSAVFSYPEFDKTIFSKINTKHLHEAPTNMGWKSDQVNVGKLINFLETRDKDKPFMTFMFFESPHSRYYFPQESIIRENYIKDFNYAKSVNKKNMPLIKNRYINSVHHLDSQIARILNYVNKSKLFENTIVVITGDHGEEFMEKGRWGHGSQFTDEQIRVPLIISIPGTGVSIINRMTSHLDIPATILPYLGVTNKAEDYSLGNNLLGTHIRKYTVVSDWNSIGYIGSKYKAVFPLKSAGYIENKVTTSDDKPVDDENKFFTENQDKIVSIMHNLSTFTVKGNKK